ncbi:flavodoxin [Loigolactobacillus zhaoyuanensis]|uniref:Flavodoxin n=2 Tax=Loigolactobacillus zhaoyuanensis TaxID=2486017 RepID=A0ABW8U8M5_9LACO
MVIYFSHAGQNKQHGAVQYINSGNTALVAQKLAAQLDCRCLALQASVPYSTNYAVTLQRAKTELAQQVTVAAQPLIADLTAEKKIFIGFPIWWGTLPQVMTTFLQRQPWATQKIYPFCTHEGSGFGRSQDDLEKLVLPAVVAPGLAVRGSKAYQADQAINNWLKHLEMER